jgi:hypothetical protein
VLIGSDSSLVFIAVDIAVIWALAAWPDRPASHDDEL